MFVCFGSVECMDSMFAYTRFRGNIGDWKITSLKHLWGIFKYCRYNQNLYKWKVQRPDLKLEKIINKRLLEYQFSIRWIEY
jgi:hypothetical protein